MTVISNNFLVMSIGMVVYSLVMVSRGASSAGHNEAETNESKRN